MNAVAQFLHLVPAEFAREHLVLAAEGEGGAEPWLLHGPATDPLAIHNVSARLGVSLALKPWNAEELARQIDAAYSPHQRAPESGTGPSQSEAEGVPNIVLDESAIAGEDADRLTDDLDRAARGAERDLLALGSKAPVVRMVDRVLFDAIGLGASDVHVQPLADTTLIRYRVDGVLFTARRVHARLASAVVSRIKVMARLDVAERRAPQDGRATVTVGAGRTARAVDLRIATLPSAYGERVVLRLLDAHASRGLSSLESLGMPEDIASVYRDRAGRSWGIVLVTGPTGSGKTTTLYATLRWLAARSSGRPGASSVNVLTIEDPIEYDLTSMIGHPGDQRNSLPISQTQLDPKKGLTFATGLRHILRQDPDVIMVGEIRDLETARVAIQASLTGHLVFSTLHTGDSIGAVTRLVDLGAEPFLVASALSCVLAQRLVRLLHRDCAGAGCRECLFSGYRGRQGIFELLTVDLELRHAIGRGAALQELKATPAVADMRGLHAQGLELIRRGLTSEDEVRRVILGAE